jgi:hypothetical protein
MEVASAGAGWAAKVSEAARWDADSANEDRWAWAAEVWALVDLGARRVF